MQSGFAGAEKSNFRSDAARERRREVLRTEDMTDQVPHRRFELAPEPTGGYRAPPANTVAEVIQLPIQVEHWFLHGKWVRGSGNYKLPVRTAE
jgi:hypothetical protein